MELQGASAKVDVIDTLSFLEIYIQFLSTLLRVLKIAKMPFQFQSFHLTLYNITDYKNRNCMFYRLHFKQTFIQNIHILK